MPVSTECAAALLSFRYPSILIILQILRHTRHAIRFCPKAREEERLCHDIAKEYLRGRDTQYISDHF